MHRARNSCVTGIDDDGWIAKSADFKAPAFDGFKVLKLDLEMPGWAPIASNKHQGLGRRASGSIGRRSRAQTFESVYVPLPPGAPAPRPPRRLGCHSASRATAGCGPSSIKNISFENLSQTDLFARGWHPSGYLFGINGADTDGWVNRRLRLQIPGHTTVSRKRSSRSFGTRQSGTFPSECHPDGGAEETRTLELEQTERIRIPLSRTHGNDGAFSRPTKAFLLRRPTRESVPTAS